MVRGKCGSKDSWGNRPKILTFLKNARKILKARNITKIKLKITNINLLS
jgi:hypothetical protein